MSEDSEGHRMEMEAQDAYDEAMGEWSTVPAGFWRTREGTVIEILTMTDAHLANAVRYCENEGVGKHPKVTELRVEQRRRQKGKKHIRKKTMKEFEVFVAEGDPVAADELPKVTSHETTTAAETEQ